jgi:hypothetical protein
MNMRGSNVRGFHWRGIATVLALVAVVSACGGSSYKGLTKAEFIKQADAICKNYNEQATAATKNLDPNASQQQVIDVIENKLAPLFEKQQGELEALKWRRCSRSNRASSRR